MEIQNIFSFVENFVKQGFPRIIASNPLMQFGTENDLLFFARFLPVIQTETNTVYEEVVKVGAGFVANDGSPMSAPQIKQVGVSGMGVTFQLGHYDIASQFDARELSDLGKLLNSGTDKALAEQYLTNWMITRLRMAIEKKTELARIDAIINGKCTISPLDSAPYDIKYPLPNNYRRQFPNFWDSALNPLIEVFAPLLIEFRDKGFEIDSIITSNKVFNSWQLNTAIAYMTGGSFVFDSQGRFRNVGYRLGASVVQGAFIEQGLPEVTIFDTHYEDQLGNRRRYVPDDIIIVIGRTNRNQLIDVTDLNQRILRRELIRGTLGYVAEGISLGNTVPGMTMRLKTSEDKPVGVYGSAWVERFPIYMESEAVVIFEVGQKPVTPPKPKESVLEVEEPAKQKTK